MKKQNWNSDLQKELDSKKRAKRSERIYFPSGDGIWIGKIFSFRPHGRKTYYL